MATTPPADAAPASAYAAARQIDAQTIPVIDVTPLRDGDGGGDVRRVAAALHRASRDLGFIYIRGHGIDDADVAAARASAYRFFRSPVEAKRRVAISAAHRGWLGAGGAKMRDDAAADLKESFIWGFEDDDGRAADDHPLRGANRWPPFVPELRRCALTFFAQADRVARLLLRGFAIGLGLQDDFFLRHSDRPLSRASFVYYPPQPAELGADRFGVGPHTDFGVLTVLCQDDVGGLQVQNAAGDWLYAPPLDGTLVVNVGDLLARWTDGAYKSTPHRVVNRSGRERLSLVLAFDPAPETLIDAREVYGATYRAAQPPIACGDYLNWRFGKAFGYRAGR